MILRHATSVHELSERRSSQRRKPKWMDRLLFRVLDVNRRVRGYTIHPAERATDITDHEQLVRSTFLGQGYYHDPDTPLKAEPTGSASKIWIARHHGDAVGTIRLIQNARQWPMDLVFPVRLPPHVHRLDCAEIGRFNIARAHRRRRWMVSFELLKAAYEYSLANGIRWWVGCAPTPLIMGFRPYARHLELLEPLPVEDYHIHERAGRETYFTDSQAVRGFLFHLEDVSILQMARKILLQRIRQGNFLQYKPGPAS